MILIDVRKQVWKIGMELIVSADALVEWDNVNLRQNKGTHTYTYRYPIVSQFTKQMLTGIWY